MSLNIRLKKLAQMHAAIQIKLEAQADEGCPTFDEAWGTHLDRLLMALNVQPNSPDSACPTTSLFNQYSWLILTAAEEQDCRLYAMFSQQRSG